MPSRKTRLNFINDMLLFTCMMLIIGIGFVMEWVLPRGQKAKELYGRGADVTLWGWDRHDFGEVHFILGLIFLGLLMLHLILHWSYIKGTFRNYIGNRWVRVLVIALLLFVGLGSLSTWLLEPTVTQIRYESWDHDDEADHSHFRRDREGRKLGEGRGRR